MKAEPRLLALRKQYCADLLQNYVSYADKASTELLMTKIASIETPTKQAETPLKVLSD